MQKKEWRERIESKTFLFFFKGKREKEKKRSNNSDHKTSYRILSVFNGSFRNRSSVLYPSKQS
tara:strand:+ start:746 stop:934 length:189 start_codon:yes stop_codon:yes gene_type:complete